MEISKYTTSLSISKKLKEAGFKQNTGFYWRTFKKLNSIWCKDMMDEDRINDLEGVKYISAPLISEILEELANNEIMDYSNARPEMKQGEFIGLFRDPNKMAEVWLEVHKNERN